MFNREPGEPKRQPMQYATRTTIRDAGSTAAYRCDDLHCFVKVSRITTSAGGKYIWMRACELSSSGSHDSRAGAVHAMPMVGAAGTIQHQDTDNTDNTDRHSQTAILSYTCSSIATHTHIYTCMLVNAHTTLHLYRIGDVNIHTHT